LFPRHFKITWNQRGVDVELTSVHNGLCIRSMGIGGISWLGQPHCLTEELGCILNHSLIPVQCTTSDQSYLGIGCHLGHILELQFLNRPCTNVALIGCVLVQLQ
jgi:hypothetical protein